MQDTLAVSYMKSTTGCECVSVAALALIHLSAPAPAGKDDTCFKGV